MKRFRVIFMGTPEFAVPCLASLAEYCEIAGVITQPDKPSGRGQKLRPSPVKVWAENHGYPVWQPAKVRTEDCVAFLREKKPDLFIVVAFGQILSQELLDIPKYGCINVHASLLPHYRGAAPMQWCIINGEKETGVTTMFMDAGLDTGDMLIKETMPIGEDATLEDVHDGLMNLGAKALYETLEKLSEGTLERHPQTGESNYAGRITKETGHIDWTKSAEEIHNLVRGLNPVPGAYTFLDGKKFKIWKAELAEKTEVMEQHTASDLQPGMILAANAKDGLLVVTGHGILKILELQAPGKKRMDTAAYLNGHGIELPAVFESAGS